MMISRSNVRCTGHRSAISTSRWRCSSVERPIQHEPLGDAIQEALARLAVLTVLRVHAVVLELDLNPFQGKPLPIGVHAAASWPYTRPMPTRSSSYGRRSRVSPARLARLVDEQLVSAG